MQLNLKHWPLKGFYFHRKPKGQTTAYDAGQDSLSEGNWVFKHLTVKWRKLVVILTCDLHSLKCVFPHDWNFLCWYNKIKVRFNCLSFTMRDKLYSVSISKLSAVSYVIIATKIMRATWEKLTIVPLSHNYYSNGIYEHFTNRIIRKNSNKTVFLSSQHLVYTSIFPYRYDV